MSFAQPPFQSVLTDAASKISSVWSQWIMQLHNIVNSLTLSGTTAQRPSGQLWVGQRYWDSTLNQLVAWNGSEWVSCAVGYYASFYDNTNQSAANTTTAYAVTCNTGNGHYGITMEDSSKITFAHPGTYNIQFSIQFVSTETNTNNPANVNIWFRKNGTDVPESNSRFDVPTKHGTHNGHLIAAMNFIVTTTADNDYVEIIWQTENTLIFMETLAAGTTPNTPVTPSVIITAQQI